MKSRSLFLCLIAVGLCCLTQRGLLNDRMPASFQTFLHSRLTTASATAQRPDDRRRPITAFAPAYRIAGEQCFLAAAATAATAEIELFRYNRFTCSWKPASLHPQRIDTAVVGAIQGLRFLSGDQLLLVVNGENDRQARFKILTSPFGALALEPVR